MTPARARIMNDLTAAHRAAHDLTEQTGEPYTVILGEIDPETDEYTVAVCNPAATAQALAAGYGQDTD